MKKKCPQCRKLRVRLLSNFAVLLLLNYLTRSHFGYDTTTIIDLLLVPAVITLLLGAALLFFTRQVK